MGLITAGILDNVDMTSRTPIGKTLGEDFYYKPWFSIQPYIMGLLLGFILFKLRNKPIGVSKDTVIWMWALAGFIGSLCVYGSYDIIQGKREISFSETIAFVGLSKLGWSLALGWVILA